MGTDVEDAPERGEVFDLLSNHRRRYVIHFCKQQDGEVTVSDLAEQVAAWENEKTVEEIDHAERKRVYTSLQQTHLPTLADSNMIHYDNSTVELTDRATELDVYLDVVPGGSIAWGEYYLGLSVIGFGVVVGVAVGILPTTLLPAVGWAALVVAAFATSAAVHVYQSRQFRLGEPDVPT
jgi:VIT1/CCC1 family predicted Fe2+/Mn2+ transporter